MAEEHRKVITEISFQAQIDIFESCYAVSMAGRALCDKYDEAETTI